MICSEQMKNNNVALLRGPRGTLILERSGPCQSSDDMKLEYVLYSAVLRLGHAPWGNWCGMSLRRVRSESMARQVISRPNCFFATQIHPPLPWETNRKQPKWIDTLYRLYRFPTHPETTPNTQHPRLLCFKIKQCF